MPMILGVLWAILSLFWRTAASLLTDTLVARGIEAFGSVEAAQEAVEHGKVLEFRDLLCFFFSVFSLCFYPSFLKHHGAKLTIILCQKNSVRAMTIEIGHSVGDLAPSSQKRTTSDCVGTAPESHHFL